MASALPLRPSIDHTPRPSSEFDLTEDDSSTVLDSLASETARAVLTTLADGPATASDIADEVDTSIQNAHYHLSNLCEAGIVASVGTWYSAKGKEMPVYDLTSEEIQLRIGSHSPNKSSNTVKTDDSTTRPSRVSP